MTTRKPLSLGDVAKRVAGGLTDPPAFFKAVRAFSGALEQSQVDGFNFLLAEMAEAKWPLSYAAYGLATAWHETNCTMQPVVEAYWLSEGWRKANLRYYPWHGRGFVQLTWQENYKRADKECGLDGKLLADPELARDPEIAAKILVRGMAGGWFTEKKLSDYLTGHGPGSHRQFVLARYIINGTDKASKIADEALRFQQALQWGGWQ